MRRPPYFILSLLNLNSLLFAAGVDAPIKDTCSHKSISVINTLQKNSSAFPKDQLVTMIDSLMEMDTVSSSYYTYILGFLKKEKNKEESLEELFSGAGFYSTWDNKNFYNQKDLLKEDTVVSIFLLDSLHGKYVHPCPGIITSSFGWRDNVPHKGIDLDLNKGDKVFSVFDGVVRIATKHVAYGNVVVVRHYNGLETTYAHLSRIKVKEGQTINAGDVVGLGGSTGKSTGSHLHFETRFKGLAINPADIISFKDKRLICDREILIRNNKWGIYAYPKYAEFYTVKKGDSLFEIAKKYGVTTSHLRALNGISKKAYLKVGYKLRIS